MKPFLVPRPVRKGPGAIECIVVYFAILAYTLFAGRWLGRVGGSSGVMVFTVGLGVIPFLYAYVRGYSVREVFIVSVPRQRDVAGGLLMSMGLFVFVLFACNILVFAVPDIASKGAPMQDFMVHGNLLVAVLAVAILPAACEEVLFRGFILSGLLSSAGKWPAIVICGILFGALHLQPLQMPLTALVGVGLAYAAYESRSILVPVAMHCVHNLFLLLIVRGVTIGDSSGEASAQTIRGFVDMGPAAVVALAIAALVVSATLIGASAFFVFVGVRMIKRDKTPP